ncbi:acyl carrier protein, partial [Streptomyces europaeiscabiei]
MSTELPDTPTELPGTSTDSARTPVDTTRTPPATPTEHLLARAWSELLDIPESEIGRRDDFFALGGDSITVLELFSRLRHERPALPRPTAVYTHRTLVALAAAIDDTTVPTVTTTAPAA